MIFNFFFSNFNLHLVINIDPSVFPTPRQVVSDALQRSDFKSLEGLVDKEAIASLKTAVSQLSVSQRQMLAVDKEDIFYAFPYQVGFVHFLWLMAFLYLCSTKS